MIKLKQLLTEKTVRLSTMKDANFEPGQFVQLMGKKGMVKLDKKSVHSLAKIIRQLSGKKGMGWSFTMGEGKLTEAVNAKEVEAYVKKKGLKDMDLPFWKVGIDYPFYPTKYHEVRAATAKEAEKQISRMYSRSSGGKVGKAVFDDSHFLKVNKNLKEGKLNEGSKVVTLPNGIKVKIDFKGLTLQSKGKPVFLDRKEMEIFFKATSRYLK